MKGLTLSEISKKLNISVNTLRQRITRLKIKPLSQEATYAYEVLKILKNVPGRGKPKKDDTSKKIKLKTLKNHKFYQSTKYCVFLPFICLSMFYTVFTLGFKNIYILCRFIGKFSLFLSALSILIYGTISRIAQ